MEAGQSLSMTHFGPIRRPIYHSYTQAQPMPPQHVNASVALTQSSSHAEAWVSESLRTQQVAHTASPDRPIGLAAAPPAAQRGDRQRASQRAIGDGPDLAEENLSDAARVCTPELVPCQGPRV